jgi:transposase
MDDVTPSTEVCLNCVELGRQVKKLTHQVQELARRNAVVRRQRRRDQAEIRKLRSTVAGLKDELAETQGRVRATAANSSLPPSANPPGAKKPVVKKPTGRRSGAQRGHKGHGRRLLPIERVDTVERHRPGVCERCHAELPGTIPGTVLARAQQAELPPRAVTITEHQAIGCACPECRHVTAGRIPDQVLASVCGPRLSAAITYLSACALVSRRGVEEALSVLLGMKLSLGCIGAREKEMSDALADPYQQLKQQAREAAVKHVDETGWKRAAQWLWVAATATVVVFLCSHKRTFGVLRQLLGGKLTGWICSDRAGIYDKCPKKRRGLCWAHLKRDFQKLVDRGGGSGKIGREALAITREVFHRWRRFKEGRIGRTTLKRLLKPLRSRMKRVLERGAASGIGKTSGLCRRLLGLWGPMWRFATVQGLEPTNNLAERMLRRGVIWRKKSFGSDSAGGCRYVERMLSVTMTLRMRGGNVLDYLAEAVLAHRQKRPVPGVN